MPFELDPEEADWDDSLAVDSFTFWEEQAVASERIAAAPRIAKYVFFIYITNLSFDLVCSQMYDAGQMMIPERNIHLFA